MNLVLLASTIIAQAPAGTSTGITIDTKGIETVRSYKHPFELKAGSGHGGVFFPVTIPSGMSVPIPVRIQFSCFFPNTKTPAPKLEVLYLSIQSDKSTVYNSYNLQKVDRGDFSFKCAIDGNRAEFALNKEGGIYDARGTISATAFRRMFDMKPKWEKHETSYETSLPLSQTGDILLGASIKMKVGGVEAMVPSTLTIKRGQSTIYQKDGAKHSLALHIGKEAVSETSRVFIGIKPKQASLLDKPNVRADFKAICYPPFAEPKWGY